MSRVFIVTEYQAHVPTCTNNFDRSHIACKVSWDTINLDSVQQELIQLSQILQCLSKRFTK